MSKHIDITLTSCSQSLFALKTLRAHDMPYSTICDVSRATTMTKIIYGSPAWWGFTSAADRQRLEAFVAKSKKMKLYGDNDPTISELCEKQDDALFRKIASNPAHVLHYCYHHQPPMTITLDHDATTVPFPLSHPPSIIRTFFIDFYLKISIELCSFWVYTLCINLCYYLRLSLCMLAACRVFDLINEY